MGHKWPLTTWLALQLDDTLCGYPTHGVSQMSKIYGKQHKISLVSNPEQKKIFFVKCFKQHEKVTLKWRITYVLRKLMLIILVKLVVLKKSTPGSVDETL